MKTCLSRHANQTREFLDNISIEELSSLYSEWRSQKTKAAYSKWKKSNDEREESFSERSLRGMRSWARKNCKKDLTDTEAYEFAKSNMKPTNHGLLIKQGLAKKHGDKLSDEFRRRRIQAIANYFDVSAANVTEEMNKEFSKKNAIKSTALEWKTSHIRNIGKNIDEMSPEEIEIAYSEYLSLRYKRESLDHYNGYKRSKKGWFKFATGVDVYCRSSWEFKFCNIVNEKIIQRPDLTARSPDRIMYFCTATKVNRHYYPDFLLTSPLGKLVVEIKPLSKTTDQTNVDKFLAASKLHGKDFVVVTEEELFRDSKIQEIIERIL